MIKRNLLIVSLGLVFSIGLFGCKKNENVNVINIDTMENVIDDEIIIDDNNNDNKLIQDVPSISEEEDDILSYVISDDTGEENSTIEYSLEKLTFGEWGFEVSIPKQIINDYELINDMSKLNINSVDNMMKTYVITTDNCFQIFNLDDKYFGIFVDEKPCNEDWHKAIDECLYDYIKQIIPNNSFYSYKDNYYPSKEIYGDNSVLISFPITITPTIDKTITYDGYIGYLTIDNTIYYILYGENTIYDISMKDGGYKNIVFSSINVLDNFIKNSDTEKEREYIDYDLYEKIKEELNNELKNN